MKRKKGMITWIIAGVAVLVVAGLAARIVLSRPKGPSYLTEAAKLGDVELSITATGQLQPLNLVNVGAQASGQIESLKVAPGDKVRRGQILAVIDPSTQQNTLDDAQAALVQINAQLESTQANIEQAQLNLSRQRDLFAQGVTTQANLDQAMTALRVGQAGYRAQQAGAQQAQIRVDRAKVDLGRTNILAPIDGVVSSVAVREGQTVNAVQQAPTIVRLAQMDVMTVKAQISEADVIKVQPGQAVYFTILGDAAKRYNATLRTVEPAPDSAANETGGGGGGGSAQAIYYNALFDVPNADGRLRTSMTAQVTVVQQRAQGVLTVPSSALGKKGADGRYEVKLLGADGKPVPRQVSVGLNNNVTAQITDGLKMGEKVIVAELSAADAKAQARENVDF